jgi:bifunctional non-homologous end joining protein LigD
MLATLGSLPAEQRGWSYEFKWDGVRAIAFTESGSTRLVSRNGNDLTESVPSLSSLPDLLGAGRQLRSVLDGELVAFDTNGHPSFQLFQQRAGAITYVCFDLVYLDGRSYVDETYTTRRDVLEALVGGGGEEVMTSPRFSGTGQEVLDVSKERGLEGIMAKRDSSPYRIGRRSSEWLKIKNLATQEVVVGGWTPGHGSRNSRIGSLLIGIPSGDNLVYVGQVGTGFTRAILDDLELRLFPLQTTSSPFVGEIPSRYRAVAHYVRPCIVGEVRFSEWTTAGRLRHPAWRGLRLDKEPTEVVRES